MHGVVGSGIRDVRLRGVSSEMCVCVCVLGGEGM